MASAASDFWLLERTNRRETVILVVAFIALFCAMGFGLDLLIGDLAIRNGVLVGFPLLTVVAFLFGGIQALASYYGGASLILASVHATALKPDTEKHQMVLNVVSEMAIAARMPPIKAYLIADPAPNAFATGRDPAHSVICVTQGLVDAMDREELQGVIGHEMAHIRDYDIRTMMMIAVLVGGVAMLADFVYRWTWYADATGRRDNEANGEGAGARTLIAIAVFLLAILAPIFSQLLAMAVSRQREYLADAASVEFTRNPRALLRALKRIAMVASPLKHGSLGTAHLFIVNPLQGSRGDSEGFWANLLSTHPPLSRRIERLHAMLGESIASGS